VTTASRRAGHVIRHQPLTSCAHRLRKPEPDQQTSDALCRVTPSRRTGSYPCLTRTPLTGASRRTSSLNVVRRSTPRQTCWARRRVRTTHTARIRAPSVGSSPDLAIRAGEVAFVVHSRGFASHPVARREPLPPRQRLVSRFELSRPSPVPRELPRASPCRRERCVSPTSATDSRHEHPACRPTPDHIPRRPPSQARALPATTVESSGGASLDGEPPASAPLQPQSIRPVPKHPPFACSSTAWSWWSSIELLHAVLPGGGFFGRAPSVQLGL
jgi:hypothetical protein